MSKHLSKHLAAKEEEQCITECGIPVIKMTRLAGLANLKMISIKPRGPGKDFREAGPNSGSRFFGAMHDLRDVLFGLDIYVSIGHCTVCCRSDLKDHLHGLTIQMS